MKILVIDIGGSRVKFRVSGKGTERDLPSGKRLSPKRMVDHVLATTEDWDYDAVSIGFPGSLPTGRWLRSHPT